MQKIRIFNKEIPLFIVYTMSFVIIACMTFGGFVIFGKTLVINAKFNVDGFTQHYPWLVNMKRIIVELVREKTFSFWSADIGLGNDTIGNMAMLLMDPFNYIAILFPYKYLDVGYSIAIVLRLYVAGIGMMTLLKYHKKDNFICLIGGISYAFSYWAMNAMKHGFFLNPLVLFPFVILGIDKIFKGERPYVFIISVWFSLITYIYFAYMTAIYAVIYVLVKYFLGKKNRNVKEFVLLVLKYVLYAMVAVCLSFPIIVPAIYALLNAIKTSSAQTDILPRISQVLKWLSSLVTNVDISSNYACTGAGAIALLMVPLMISKIKDREKRVPILIFIFSFFMTLIPFWGKIMNGFSYSAGRWCYILTFFYVWAAMEILEDFIEMVDREKKKIVIWMGILIIAIMAGGIFTGVISSMGITIAIFNIACAGFIYLFREKGIEILLVLVIFNIGGTYIMSFSPFTDKKLDNYMSVGACWENYSQSVLRAGKQNDKDFYRVDNIEHINASGKGMTISNPANEGLFWNVGNTTLYLSTVEGKLLKYNRELENNSGYTRRVFVWGNDNRSRLNFLQGVKYFVSEGKNAKKYAGYGFEKIKKKKGVTVQEQKYNSGLGYVFDSVMKESDFNKYSALEKEQIMMQTAIVPDEEYNGLGIGEFNKNQARFDIKKAKYRIDSNSSVQPENNSFSIEHSKSLNLQMDKYKNCEVYVEFVGLKKKPYSAEKLREINLGTEKMNDKYTMAKYTMAHLNNKSYGNFELFVSSGTFRKRIVNTEGEPQGISDRVNYMINLGYFKETNKNINIEFKTQGQYTYDSLNVYIVSQKGFDEQAEELSNNRFTMTGKSANTIAGTVNTKDGGFLYLSLLNHPGWKAYIDGKLQKIYRTDICFSGIKVNAGKHKIELVYRPLGFKMDLLMLGVGCVVLCSVEIVAWRKRRSK